MGKGVLHAGQDRVGVMAEKRREEREGDEGELVWNFFTGRVDCIIF